MIQPNVRIKQLILFPNRQNIPSNLLYEAHQIPISNCCSYRLAVVFAQSTEARRKVENEDVVGAAPTGDAPTTSEWSALLLPTKVPLILEVWRWSFWVWRRTGMFCVLLIAIRDSLTVYELCTLFLLVFLYSSIPSISFMVTCLAQGRLACVFHSANSKASMKNII